MAQNNDGPINLNYKVYEPENVIEENLSPFIFLHGITSSGKSWNNIVENIVSMTGRKAYVIDARNHGDSEWRDAFNFDILTDDLDHFLKRLHICRVVLVGHSMGGITAMKYALKRPKNVEALFVEDMVIRIPTGIWRLLGQSIQKSQQQLESANERLASLRLENSDLARKILQDENEARLFIMSSANVNNKFESTSDILMGVFNCVASCFSSAFELTHDRNGLYRYKPNLKVIAKALENPQQLMKQWADSYNGPALFIHGTSVLSVQLSGPDKEEILRYFPNAKFCPVEGGDHFIHQNHLEQFILEIINFLQKTSVDAEVVNHYAAGSNLI